MRALTEAHAPPSATAARWHWRPRLWGALLIVVLVPVFISLGQWQWDKAERKSALQTRLDTLATDAPIQWPAGDVTAPEALHFRRVSLHGRYDGAGQILLDNQLQKERPGWQVLTPLVISGSDRRVLINRGWLPAGPRNATAGLAPPPAGVVTLTGTAILPASRFFSLAPDTAPPRDNALWQHLDLARYHRESNVPLAPLIVRLDPGEGDGLIRAWARPDERHERHRSYALQWYGFALAAVFIWLWQSIRREPA